MIKDKLLLVGAGGFGRVVSEMARKDYNCSFIDDGHCKGENICGIEVVGNTSDLTKLFREYKKLVVTIGDNKTRQKIYKTAEKIGYSFPNILGNNVYISEFAVVGHGCVFENNVSIQNGSKIGDGVILNPGVEVHHDSTIEDYVLIYTNSVIRTYAKVLQRARIGSNVTISNNVIIDTDADILNGQTVLSV